MNRYEATVFDFTKDRDDKLLMTSHEETNGGIAIHSSEGHENFTVYINKGQAKDLIIKLQEGIINLEVYERK